MDILADKRQDMPPKGGFGPVTYKRIPPKSYFKGWQLFGGYCVMTGFATYLYYLNDKSETQNKIERRSANNVLYALLLAERDREFLKQLRRNRDEEAKLMASVPGWEVGKYYGEPIFHGLSKDTFVSPVIEEYFVHSDPKALQRKQNLVNMV